MSNPPLAATSTAATVPSLLADINQVTVAIDRCWQKGDLAGCQDLLRKRQGLLDHLATAGTPDLPAWPAAQQQRVMALAQEISEGEKGLLAAWAAASQQMAGEAALAGSTRRQLRAGRGAAAQTVSRHFDRQA